SKIIHFNLNEKKLEVFLEAKDLFEILTNFKKSSYFSEVKLTGSPIVDPRTKVYRFRLEVALR
ncbi:MAG: hypothetical protein N3A56_08120, partial [Thermodesulfobacteriaceae bacterium]|nr:hypothetical protein [Thermodesulfobacteriaceae bacterium]